MTKEQKKNKGEDYERKAPIKHRRRVLYEDDVNEELDAFRRYGVTEEDNT